MEKKLDALVGYTGFIGSSLLRQHRFDSLFNSKNFQEIEGRSFNQIVCTGLPAAKWLANRDPDKDIANINALCDALRTAQTRQFILISTIDVYPRIASVDENFDCHSMVNNAYGAHRLMFEDFVAHQFPSAHILRLPALFGHGLKKNVVYDLLHDNCLDMINPASSFQWYDVGRLWDDIDTAVEHGLSLAGLMTEPVETRKILDRFFPEKSVGENASAEVHYDVRTRHDDLFGGERGYIMDEQEILERLGRYIASEKVTADA